MVFSKHKQVEIFVSLLNELALIMHVESLRKIINYAIGQGVSGILILGNMGDGTDLLLDFSQLCF